MSNTEKILEVISKLEKQKNVLLDKREQLQFHARIATKQKADLATQIREVTSFKAEKESNQTLVKLRVDTRQSHLDDIKTRIDQCTLSIQRNQEGLNAQSERQFDMIRELEEATIGLSERMSRSCDIKADSSATNTQEILQLDQQIEAAEKVNRQLREEGEGLQPARNSNGLTAMQECQIRCDFAINFLQETVAQIDTNLQEIKELIDIENEDEEGQQQEMEEDEDEEL